MTFWMTDDVLDGWTFSMTLDDGFGFDFDDVTWMT